MVTNYFENSSFPTTNFLFPPTALEYRTARLKKLFTPLRNVLIPLNNLLQWKNQYDPLIIFTFLTILFFLIYLFNPPILTLISCLTLLCVLVDLFGPSIFGIDQQNIEQKFFNDRIYAQLCERLAYFEQIIEDRIQSIMKIRAEKPIIFLIIGSICLIILAYCGQCFNNLLLTYLIMLIIGLLPGVIHQQIIQRLPSMIFNLGKKIFSLINNKIKRQ